MKEIREKMVKLLDEIRTLAADKDKLTAEETEKLNRMNSEYEALDMRFKTLMKVEEEEKRLASGSSVHESDIVDMTKDENQRAAFRKYMQSGSLRNLKPEERQWLESRAQTVTTSGGGYLVPTSLAREIEISYASYASVLNVARVVRDEMGNPFNWPTVNDTSNKGRLLTINTQVTTTDIAFGQVQFSSYKFSSDQVLVPWELAISSGINLDELIRELLAERVGRIMADYFIAGTGTGQPEGINACNKGRDASSATALSYADLVALMHSIDPAYRNPNCKWAFNNTTLALIRLMKDDASQYIFKQGDSGIPDRILGHEYIIMQGMDDVGASKKSVMFGDWTGYVVRLVQDMRMRVLTERYADYDQIGYFLLQSMDARWINKNKVKHILHPAT